MYVELIVCSLFYGLFQGLFPLGPAGPLDKSPHRCVHAFHCSRPRQQKIFHFILYFTIWGVEPTVTHQASWLESPDVQQGI